MTSKQSQSSPVLAPWSKTFWPGKGEKTKGLHRGNMPANNGAVDISSSGGFASGRFLRTHRTHLPPLNGRQRAQSSERAAAANPYARCDERREPAATARRWDVEAARGGNVRAL